MGLTITVKIEDELGVWATASFDSLAGAATDDIVLTLVSSTLRELFDQIYKGKYKGSEIVEYNAGVPEEWQMLGSSMDELKNVRTFKLNEDGTGYVEETK